MKCVDFYCEVAGNCNGHRLSDILKWSDGALEMDHDWVQWVFPSIEPSQLNCDAPVLTAEEVKVFQASPDLQDKVKQSFVRFLKFLQFELVQDGEDVEVQASVEKPHWLNSFNHTMLRVTRLLKSLRLTGNTKYAVAMYTALTPFKTSVSMNTWDHWTKATFGPLEC